MLLPNGEEKDAQSQVNLLGIILDEQLTFREHIAKAAFWESISRREESRNKVIIASVVNWKQLNISSRNVLCIQ